MPHRQSLRKRVSLALFQNGARWPTRIRARNSRQREAQRRHWPHREQSPENPHLTGQVRASSIAFIATTTNVVTASASDTRQCGSVLRFRLRPPTPVTALDREWNLLFATSM